MDNKELFQKYLDNELSVKEKLEVEDLLKSNPEENSIFQSMKTDQEKILETLDLLNPLDIVVPSKFAPPKQSQKIMWRIAAAIVILIGISAVLWLSNRTPNSYMEENVIAEKVTEETISNELDYYISPNRCWRNRELVWTFLQTK